MVLTDPIKRISQIETFKKQLKDIPYENIISLDETSTDTHLKYSLGWSKKGSKKEILLTNKKIRYTTKKEFALRIPFSRSCEKIKTLFLFSQYYDYINK